MTESADFKKTIAQIPHDHREQVPGCFRCELSVDEREDWDSLKAWQAALVELGEEL